MASTDWKLVTKQLPNNTYDCWVTLEHVDGWRTVKVSWYDKDNNEWDYEDLHPEYQVLAWMPIPPPFVPEPYNG